jgi:hypothetical protein
MVSEHRKRGFPEGWLADTFGAHTNPMWCLRELDRVEWKKDL